MNVLGMLGSEIISGYLQKPKTEKKTTLEKPYAHTLPNRETLLAREKNQQAEIKQLGKRSHCKDSQINIKERESEIIAFDTAIHCAFFLLFFFRIR